MKKTLTKNRIFSYLNKSGFSQNPEKYKRIEKRSSIYFYGDKEDEGTDQNVAMIKGIDEIVFDKIDEIFKELSASGYINLRCEIYKNYYTQSKVCKPLMLQKSILVYEYRCVN